MGFESNWYFAEVALLKAGAGPLTSDELGVPIALPTNHDLGFWQDLSTSQYRMWGELRRLVPGKSEQAILDQLVAEELIPPPAPRVSIYELRDVRLMEQARPRKNVTASLSRGPLPADSRVIASSAVAAMPTLV